MVLNVAFYGLVMASIALAMYLPELREPFAPSIGQSTGAPPATHVGQLFLSSFTQVTLPSLLIPFAGVLVQLYRASLWGVMHAPVDGLALMIEGQAYVLVAFAAYVQGRMFLWPEYYRMSSHRAGFKAGAVATLRIYVLIVMTLALGAVFSMLGGADLPFLT